MKSCCAYWPTTNELILISTLQNDFWVNLQRCAAKRGRHEVIEMIRDSRVKVFTGDRAGDWLV